MTQSTSTERAAFEAHMLKLNPCARLYRHTCVEGDRYRTVTIQRNWELWQAARRAPAAPVQMPEPVAEVLSNRPGNDTSTVDKSFPVGTRLYTELQVRALLAQGGAQNYENDQQTRASAGDEVVLASARAVPQPSPACWCASCDVAANAGLRMRMSLCPQCGDQRCDRAYHHDNACSAAPKVPTP